MANRKNEMKILIIIDFIVPALAVYELVWALYYAKIQGAKLQANESQLKEHGLIYLLAEDKQLLARAGRLVILLFILANGVLFTWSLSRMLSDFAPYATGFITVTAALFHLVMLGIARVIFLIYKGSKFSFLKRIKI